jgi:NADH-quinone oxidoreductase subunit M
MLWMVRRVFFGPLANDANRRLVDLGPREVLVAVAMVIPMLWIGLHPATFLRPMDRSVADFLATLERRGVDLAAYAGRTPAAAAESGE